MENQPKEDLRHEYKDLSDNLRYYANSRFVHLTLFITLNGAFIGVILTTNNLQILTNPLVSLIGFIITLIFWIVEKRGTDYWNAFHKRAIELEKQLHYQQYRRRPKPTLSTLLIGATQAIMIFYGLTLMLWILLMFQFIFQF